MTVETNAINISDLNKAYPRNRDLIKEGDDHIRLIKSVLQNTFPGMDSTVEASSEKLNKLNSTFTYTESTLNINNAITVGTDKDIDVGGNVISNVGDPVEPTDAVNLRSLQGDLMWPVGSIFMTVDSRDPKNILGFGVWEKFAAGRVIVGTGVNTDSENELVTVVNGAKGGTYSTKLVEENLPSHTHTGTGKASAAGRHNHGFPSGGASDGSGGRRALSIDISVNGNHEWSGERNAGTTAVNSDGEHTHDVDVTVGATGKGEKFNNTQPYIACNIWVRKADSTT
ncbi:MAG: phage baseplate protein [Bacteroidales bacterium]